MTSKKKVKIVGNINRKFCKDHNIMKYSDFKIVQSLGLSYHTSKHAEQFINVDSYNRTLLNIKSIIDSPYFMMYDSNKNSIKYYKKLDEFVCVLLLI